MVNTYHNTTANIQTNLFVISSTLAQISVNQFNNLKTQDRNLENSSLQDHKAAFDSNKIIEIGTSWYNQFSPLTI